MQGSANDTHRQDGCKELCNVQLSIVEHVKQRTWLLNKIKALSISVIFEGAEILNCRSESQRGLWGTLPNLKLWQAWKISTKEDWYATKFGPHPKI